MHAVGVLSLWVVVFFKSIPGFIDGSLFKAPYLAETPPPPPPPAPTESMIPTGMNVLDINGYTPTSGTTPTKYPTPGDAMQYIYPAADEKYLSHNSDPEAQLNFDGKFGSGGDTEKVIVLPVSGVTSRASSDKDGEMKSRPQSVHMPYAKSIVG